MSTRFGEFQLLRAAHVVSRDRFCIAIHELDVDNQFSIILEYDGSFPQPWSRVEVRRNIADLTAEPDGSPNDRPYIAISDEGDVFFIRDEGILTEKISGAGVYSADADGSGAIRGITIADGYLYAFGLGGQIYRRNPDLGWQRLPISDQSAERHGSIASVKGETEVYAAGAIAPQTSAVSEDIEKAQLQAAAAGDFQRFEELSKEAERLAEQQGFTSMPAGMLLYKDGDLWVRVDRGDAPPLNDLFIETPERVWAVGTGGSILLGNAKDGFKDISFHGDRNLNLISITKLGNRMIVASDYGLHSFDGHSLSPLKPKLDPFTNRNVPNPKKVQSLGDVMFYFDYKHGVHRFDGENWEEIAIPPELLQKKFDGLGK
ncbi:hypothetical protein SJ05684_b57710 (plasmid) [Sinorhizobium sojae CCBAU 05684]|uniref:Uncharacterized protein n=1 Tax=Sinorhizobium sojae CCBAU 05684 TaxID=716928 RepID=A0A249PLE2_9HYPH|nr:hypothetical protein [Sinorhizobium sojae]ASY66753.1 hypothetical protein SJ05684_b57710 [Sinorhizobium sojae CCBAU 05684]